LLDVLFDDDLEGRNGYGTKNPKAIKNLSKMTVFSLSLPFK
jgi:hypothetical protein